MSGGHERQGKQHEKVPDNSPIAYNRSPVPQCVTSKTEQKNVPVVHDVSSLKTSASHFGKRPTIERARWLSHFSNVRLWTTPPGVKRTQRGVRKAAVVGDGWHSQGGTSLPPPPPSRRLRCIRCRRRLSRRVSLSVAGTIWRNPCPTPLRRAQQPNEQRPGTGKGQRRAAVRVKNMTLRHVNIGGLHSQRSDVYTQSVRHPQYRFISRQNPPREKSRETSAKDYTYSSR